MIKLGFDKIVRQLSRLRLPECDVVIGIGYGGMVPAALLAYKLGCELRFIFFNYRDEQNTPRHDAPVLLEPFVLPKGLKSVLLVDDVSVTGNTLKTAQMLLKDYQVKTLVLVGKADYVVFPDIDSCVNWPWKFLRKTEKDLL